MLFHFDKETLRAAAQVYDIDTDAVALKVKQEFAAKEKVRSHQVGAEGSNKD